MTQEARARVRERLRRVRDTLRVRFGQGGANDILREALRAPKQIPDSQEALTDLVRGPLRQSLETRLPVGEAKTLLTQCWVALDPPSDLFDALPDTSGNRAGSRDDTTRIRADGSRPVVVLAAGTGLANRLAPTGCARRVLAFRPETALGFVRACRAHRPRAAIIDATDPVLLGASDIASALCGVDPLPLVVLWGSDQLTGPAQQALLERAGLSTVTLPVGSPFEALVDAVRSHGPARP